MSAGYTKKVRTFIAPFLAENGLNLVDVRFEKEDGLDFLRVYIDLDPKEYEKRAAFLHTKAAPEEKPDTTEGKAAAAETHIAPVAAGKVPETELSGEILPGVGDTCGASGTDCPDEILPGVCIDDCVRVSRYLGKWLDREDFIKEAYTLEVCSKGFLEP